MQSVTAQSTARYRSETSESAVRVPAGGYGFVGELGADGRWHGVSTDGKTHVGKAPEAPGVRFFNPDDPAEMAANVPFVNFGRNGRVRVDMGDEPNSFQFDEANLGRLGTNATLQRLCARGRAAEAYRIARNTRIGYRDDAVSPDGLAVLAFQFGDYELAAKSLRLALNQESIDGTRLNGLLRWRRISPYFESAAAYQSAFATLRASEKTDDTLLLTACHALACGRADMAEQALVELLQSNPGDTTASMLFASLPPSIR